VRYGRAPSGQPRSPGPPANRRARPPPRRRNRRPGGHLIHTSASERSTAGSVYRRRRHASGGGSPGPTPPHGVPPGQLLCPGRSCLPGPLQRTGPRTAGAVAADRTLGRRACGPHCRGRGRHGHSGPCPEPVPGGVVMGSQCAEQWAAATSHAQALTAAVVTRRPVAPVGPYSDGDVHSGPRGAFEHWVRWRWPAWPPPRLDDLHHPAHAAASDDERGPSLTSRRPFGPFGRR